MNRIRKFPLETHVLLLGLLGPLPAVLAGVAVGRGLPACPQLVWLAAAAGAALWVWAAFANRARAAGALANVANLLTALRQGDFSVRGNDGGARDALGLALGELNRLAEGLSLQRAATLEATALLAKIMAEVDIAVFAFDRDHRLKLANRAGERLLSSSSSGSVELGSSAMQLGLMHLLEGPAPRTVELLFAGGNGQWELRRSTFRLEGRPHELLVLSNLQRALREEERQTWQRVIRVIGHEINNSLSPIRSIAVDLQSALREPLSARAADFEDDLLQGLAVIDRRSAALDRFMTAYAKLAKLPPPRIGNVHVETWVRRAVELEQRLPVRLKEGPNLTFHGDADQLEQLLINLVRNGVDAALETGGGVEVSWRKLAGQLEVTVVDEGLGVADTRNLFVPFFTTKPEGNGIGLVLSRQICDAHSGSLTLECRPDREGALARVLLPL